ncbi:MAG TPA: hypothetical protein VHS74_19620 [Solirubrobacterales bacterium]|jgi:hypothetical protein|nr:hypothetical protein [Solirubrobacterales bacterium]
MTEIETVTVTFEELRADIDRYLEIAESIRVLVMRDGEQVAVMGPWLPGETRPVTPQWMRLYEDLFPPEPIDHECKASRALAEEREDRTFT